MPDPSHDAELPPATPKEDPEAFVLRGTPRRVVRFKRGLIIGVTGACAAGLIAITWFALEPPSFRVAAGREEGEPRRISTPEALANAPADYGAVPQLGPPLPGDLGRPILSRQRELERQQIAAAPSAADPVIAEAERRRAAIEAERQRRAAAEEAALNSAVIVQLAGRSGAAQVVTPVQPGAQAAVPAIKQAEPAAGSGAPRRNDFGRSSDGDVNSNPLRPALSPWTLSAGTLISASLITGLNSNLPGTVLAQVTEPVRDTATGRTVLIPQGARLIGSYDSVVAFGQRRALLVWQRVLFPDGSSIRLDNVPATDLAGYAGVEDQVDFHTWRLLKGVALSTLLGVGTELGLGDGESDLVRALRESTQQNAARAGDQILRRNLDVQPTLTVRPGFPLRALIHKDLVLQPWRV